MGYKAALGFCLGCMAVTGLFKVLSEREKRRARRIEEAMRDEEERRGSEGAVEDLEEKKGGE